MHSINVPSKNILKTYVENGYYHVYNRGVEKREIFLEEIDCRVFLRYIKLYLSPVEELKKFKTDDVRMYRFVKNNLFHEVDLLSYALMPNHFHLLVKQKTSDGIIKFMRRLTTSYVMYFNEKYGRVGSLFQNRYKASLILDDNSLLRCSRYIHLNPSKISHRSIDFKQHTSLKHYNNPTHPSWIKPEDILLFFNNSHKDTQNDYYSYDSFVNSMNEASEGLSENMLLEDANA